MTYTTICRQTRLRGLLVITIMLGVCIWAGTALGQGIDPVHKYAWSENAGWQNWKASNGEATVHSDHLTGFVWAENIGWIKLGADAGGPYDNDAADNWGVNQNGSGDLAGYAWSENAGWINFAPTHGGGVSIDPATGDFNGYAWGENIGWIRLSGTAADSTAYKVKTGPRTYTVTPTAGTGGTVIGAGTHTHGTTVTVTATPDHGHVFVNWTEGSTVVSCDSQYSFTVTGNRTLRANFSPVQSQYTMTGSVNPVNHGTVTGAGAYPHGALVAMTALPNQGFAVTNWIETWPEWTGYCVVTTDEQYTFQAFRNRNLTANVRPKTLPGMLMLLLDE